MIRTETGIEDVAASAKDSLFVQDDAAEGHNDREPESIKEPPPVSGDLRPTPPDRCSTVLAADCDWVGNIQVPRSIRIDGRFSGDVKAGHTVHISQSAVVEADIEASYVVIEGVLLGQAVCHELLELMPTCTVEGSAATKALAVRDGAVVNGEIRMSDRGAYSRILGFNP